MHISNNRQDWPAPYRNPYGYAESGFPWAAVIPAGLSLIGDLFGFGDGSDALAAQNQALQQQLDWQQQQLMQQQQKPAVPTWVWVAGGGAVLYLLLRDRK